MHLRNILSKFIFAYLVFCFHSSIAIANATIDPTGHKIALKITNSIDSEGNVDSEEETHVQYFTSITTALNRDGDNGQWYPESISWTKKSNTDVKLLLGVITDSYADVSLYFQSSENGTFTFDYYDSDNGVQLKKVSSGSGTFTFNAYENSIIPFDYYFTDSFDKLSVSTNLWPLRIHDGVTTTVKEGNFFISGTNYDLDDRWQGINANSIISLKKDWVVEGSAINKISDTQSRSFAAVGVDAELEEGGFSFDISIGKQGTDTILAEIYVESYNSFSDQYTSIWTDSLANEENFRLINTISSSTIYAQYFANGKWNTLSELNWKTGVVTEKNTYTGNESTHEFTNWVNPDLSIVAPFMDFVLPYYYNHETSSDQILPLAEGDLGFTNFSVTSGAPEPDPEYAPSSLVGKIYKGSMNDTYQFIDGSNAIFFHKESNFQNSEVSSITYTWSPNGNSGTLSTSLNETTTLSFTSAAEGSFSWNEQESEETSSGTFTLEEASMGNAPFNLSGDSMIIGTTTFIFKENGVVTIRSDKGSEDTTYGFVKSGNNEIVFNIPAHANGVTSTLYKMTFSSTSEGSLSEGGSGSFKYFIDGNNQPTSKGWMWFDEYPWVYSHIEGGWLYFIPTSSKLMVFSVKDQVWREMTE
ncbi:MAG: hypothetical protein CMI19_00200 [Opitutae bacterium]|nr:hypothetical protein [Opitutae bacterium]|tara:strand:+ start:7367 stop:9292 length:1926 start_codon:yes stop_codon:yes gene_type:complete